MTLAEEQGRTFLLRTQEEHIPDRRRGINERLGSAGNDWVHGETPLSLLISDWLCKVNNNFCRVSSFNNNNNELINWFLEEVLPLLWHQQNHPPSTGACRVRRVKSGRGWVLNYVLGGWRKNKTRLFMDLCKWSLYDHPMLYTSDTTRRDGTWSPHSNDDFCRVYGHCCNWAKKTRGVRDDEYGRLRRCWLAGISVIYWILNWTHLGQLE